MSSFSKHDNDLELYLFSVIWEDVHGFRRKSSRIIDIQQSNNW
jgi:hypothetical protein